MDDFLSDAFSFINVDFTNMNDDEKEKNRQLLEKRLVVIFSKQKWNYGLKKAILNRKTVEVNGEFDTPDDLVLLIKITNNHNTSQHYRKDKDTIYLLPENPDNGGQYTVEYIGVEDINYTNTPAENLLMLECIKFDFLTQVTYKYTNDVTLLQLVQTEYQSHYEQASNKNLMDGDSEGYGEEPGRLMQGILKGSYIP